MTGTEKKKRVLVVDDQIRVTRFIEINLKIRGYEPCIANSGTQALELVNSMRPDIMFLDMVMPGMDGCQVLKELRKFSNVPVVVFSASPANRDSAILAGATDFMHKPFDPAEMIKKIEVLTT
jgi:DNA-binding response OmpR family regulator